jgi:hypothetical protein
MGRPPPLPDAPRKGSVSYNPDLAGIEDSMVRRTLSASPSEPKLTRSSRANFLAAAKLREELAAKLREREELDAKREDTSEHAAGDDVAEGHESSASSKLLASPDLPLIVRMPSLGRTASQSSLDSLARRSRTYVYVCIYICMYIHERELVNDLLHGEGRYVSMYIRMYVHMLRPN